MLVDNHHAEFNLLKVYNVQFTYIISQINSNMLQVFYRISRNWSREATKLYLSLLDFRVGLGEKNNYARIFSLGGRYIYTQLNSPLHLNFNYLLAEFYRTQKNILFCERKGICNG